MTNMWAEAWKLQENQKDKDSDSMKNTMQGNLQGIQGQKILFDMENEIPADTSAADSLEKMAQGWGQNRRGMEGGIQAMFLGLAAGMKGNANKEKREKMLKYANVAKWWQDQIQSMAEVGNKAVKEKHALDSVQENIDDYESQSPSMNPLARDQYADRILDQYNQNAGTDYKRISTDSVTPTLMTLQDKRTGKTFVKNFGKKKNGMSADLFQKAVEYDQAQINRDIRKTNIDEKRANAYEKHADFDTDPVQRGMRAGLEERARKNSTYIHDREQDLFNGDEALQSMKEIRNVIDTSSKVGSTPSAALQRWYAEKTGNTEDMDTMKLNSLAYLKQLKQVFGNVVSDSDLKHAEATWPTMDKNKDALLKAIDKTITSVENKVNLYRKQINDYNQDPTANLFSSTADITKKGSVSHQQGTDTGKTITLKKNGKEETIPTTDYEKSKRLAEEQGFEVVK